MADKAPLVIDAGQVRQATAGDVISCPGLKAGTLTSGRIPYATTGGELTDSANITFDGTDLTIGGYPALTKITEATDFYVATTGDDATGDGSIGSPWATLAKALDYVTRYWFDSAASVNIRLAGGVYAQQAALSAVHPSGLRINVYGTNTISRTFSSIQSSGGASGARTYVLNLNSVADITTSDYAIIRPVVSGGVLPECLVGCHQITNVDAGNSRITIASANKWGAASFGAATGTIVIVKTILTWAGTDGIDIGNSSLGTFDKLVCVGNGTRNGVVIRALGLARFDSQFGISNWATGVVINGGQLIFGGTISKCTSGLNHSTGVEVVLTTQTCISGCTYGIYMTNHSVFYNFPDGAYITGCTTGFYVGSMSVVNLYAGTCCGNTTGINAYDGAFCYAAASVTFSNNVIDTTPALNTLGNTNAYIKR